MPKSDQILDITPAVLSTLAELEAREKYVELPGTIYNGLRPEAARQAAQQQINDLIARLRTALPANPSKKFVLTEFSKTMAQFTPADTEDREQLLRYLEEIMDIVSVASSDGLLNNWMYGSVLGALLEQMKQGKAP